jgi:signal transduction histidine kinase
LAGAIEKLGRNTFDVILTDLSVPDSVGLATVSQLREHCGQAPIIVLTSLDDEGVERDVLAAGAQDYLIKGEFGGRIVTRAILHALQRQQAMNEAQALVLELEQSQQLLREQARLLGEKNRRLRRLYKTAQEFVDNVSHDFRTPLTVIKDYVAIIREGMIGSINDEQQAMLDKVAVRADDLNNMVDDLLDVSKLESGLLGAWRRNVHVCEFMARAESMLQQRARIRNVELLVECEHDLPQVYCDAEKVDRVITNLVVNAIKYGGDRGRVRLWAQHDSAGHQVVIGVTDNGPGIEKEALQQIFRRFRQLNSHVTSTVKGFGLGLNIAQQLCRLNLGELSVQSQVGRGSTFSFTIPVSDPFEVLRRWLTLRGTGVDILRVTEIAVDCDSNSTAADEFDSFLNCLLRRDDLLFRMAPHIWLLVMVVSSSESDRWFKRAETEFARANRNRPLGPLPEYRAKTLCEWNSRHTLESILPGFEAIIRQANVAGELIAG